jgi:hypothetical protein
MGDGRDRDQPGDREQLISDEHHATGAGAVPGPVETRDSHTIPVPRDSSRIWLYVLPVVALIVAGAIWMFRTEARGDITPAPYATTGMTGQRDTGHDPEGARTGEPLNPVSGGPAVISDMALLSDKDQYAGRAVRFTAIPVFSQKGPRTFWVGRIGDRALVLLDQGAGSVELRPGEIVALEGRFERRPDDNALASAGLSNDDRTAIREEDVIIRATRVEPAPSAGANQSAIPGRQK